MNLRKILASMSKIAIAKIREPKLPWRINLAVTYLCNAGCVMCNVWKAYRENPQLVYEEMSLDYFDKLFSEEGSHLVWLHITGGEPFLRRDLAEILRIAVERCKNLVVVDTSTNGLVPKLIKTSTEQILELLREHGVVFGIGVSIDGPPELHNFMRGVEKAWEQAVNTLKMLKELEKSYSNLQVHVNYTITERNAGRLAETYDYLRRIVDLDPSEISVSIEHSGVQFQNLNKRIDYRSVKDGIVKDLLWILENSKGHRFLENPITWARMRFKRAFIRLALQYIKEPAKMPLPCEALRSSIYIDPYGNVYPCTIWGVKLGNLKDSKLMDILRSLYAKSLRRAIKEEKCPICWSGCESWASLLIHYRRALWG